MMPANVSDGTLGTGPASTQPRMETTIDSVPLQIAQWMIDVRAAFGWSVLTASARSIVTHISTDTIGTGYTNRHGWTTGYASSSGKVSTLEMTDITFQRPLDATASRLRPLEAEFMAMDDGDVPMARDFSTVMIWVFLGVITMGLAAFLIVPRWRRQVKAARELNARSLARCNDLLAQAHAILGGKQYHLTTWPPLTTKPHLAAHA